jgi:hypothetical protein
MAPIAEAIKPAHQGRELSCIPTFVERVQNAAQGHAAIGPRDIARTVQVFA